MIFPCIYTDARVLLAWMSQWKCYEGHEIFWRKWRMPKIEFILSSMSTWKVPVQMKSHQNLIPSERIFFFLSCCENLVSFLLPFFVFFFLSKRYHFIYSFDVFVHLDLHTIWSYMKTIHRMLLPNGKCFLSTSNLLAPLGWERFSTQDKYTVGGFYFTTPDAMRVRVFVACYWLLLLVVDCCCWLFGCFVASLSSRSIWLTFVFLSLVICAPWQNIIF